MKKRALGGSANPGKVSGSWPTLSPKQRKEVDDWNAGVAATAKKKAQQMAVKKKK